MNDEKGSIWRKWDLQVQTRLDTNYTCLGNNSLNAIDLKKLIVATGLTETEITAQEKEIDAQKYAKLFIKYVELFTDISVLGITDHNIGAGIDALINEAKNSSREIVILPGIEVSSAQGLHILCLFDPEKKWRNNWAESIDHFLTELGLTNGAFNAQNQPLNSTKTAQEILGITHKKGGLCIFAHIGTDNGLFKFSNTASGGNAHISVYKDNLCQMVQLPHSGNLSIGVQNIINGKDPQYGNKSATKVKCSDARKLTEIGNCFTWIKADPTFEGLKQIIFEPQERAKIQEQNPFDDRKKLHFNCIKIVGSKNFIVPDVEISLNRELVAVIGGRGSGKSALLESIAFLNEEHTKQDQNNKPKIIEFYRQNTEGKDPAPGFVLETELIDKDNNKEQYKKSLENDESLGLPFLYIGQEQLSALATNDRELTEKICELINLDFAELKKTELVEQAREYLANIENTQAELGDLYKKYSDYKDSDFGPWLDKLIKRKEEQKKKLSSKETKDLLDAIGKATERGLKLKDFKQSIEQLKLDLKNIGINKQINALNKTLKNIYPQDAAVIPSIDFAPQEEFINEKQSLIDEEMKKLRSLIIEKKKSLIALGLKEDISILLQSAETIEREINNAKKDKEVYEKKLNYLKELMILRNGLFGAIKSYLTDNTTEIDNKFVEFKGSRDDSTVEEKELFSSIIKDVSVEGMIIFDQDIFSKYLLENCFDKRVVKNVEEVKALVAKRNEKGGAKEITLESLKKWVEEELDAFLLTDSLTSRGRENFTNFIFTKWSEFLGVKAIVKLKGIPTEKLSVGQRGTLLLKIYLATATVKQIFIVDQPEDNLDNQFIMNELVPLVRQIKKSRQIIISTHNANLVVNADAEQIIVARLDIEKRDYVSGGIENKFINKSIKEILEGGEDAFRSRENKYGMGII